jgi:ATP synthase protein I
MQPQEQPSQEPERRGPGTTMRQAAIAMELPFTLVGPILVGGVIGYLLDRWLETAPLFILVFIGFGFFAGVREVYRRYQKMMGSAHDRKPE